MLVKRKETVYESGMRKTCRIPGCSLHSFAREMCEGHYQRWYRNKNISIAAMLLPLKKRVRAGLPARFEKAAK